jgi:hypothetical protein
VVGARLSEARHWPKMSWLSDAGVRLFASLETVGVCLDAMPQTCLWGFCWWVSHLCGSCWKPVYLEYVSTGRSLVVSAFHGSAVRVHVRRAMTSPLNRVGARA